jgi:uncharacterized protein YkwD
VRRVFVTVLFAALSILQHGVAAAAPAQDHNVFVARVLELTNTERQKAGLAPLIPSLELQTAAEGYSEVLASTGCFAHTCGPVPNFVDRDGQAGYSGWSELGENIAAGYPTPEGVVAGWMASPGHRANILSTRYTEIGVGMTSSDGSMGTYWTQEFGARGNAADQAAAGAAGDPISYDSGE